MTIRQLRAKTVRVGRPALDKHTSWGVYKTKRDSRLLLVVRLGSSVATLMGWKPGARIKLSLDYHGHKLRHLVLTEAPHVTPPFPALRLRNASSKTLQFQEHVGVVTGLERQAIKRALPDKRGSALYIPVG